MLKREREILYGYNDITVLPSESPVYISSRSQCDPYSLCSDYLPIFTAPMSTVVGDSNMDVFEKNHIIPVCPRNIPIKKREEILGKGKWVAFSLGEFKSLFTQRDGITLDPTDELPMRALIDVANGHMKEIYNLVELAKEIWEDKLEVMVGNIANPKMIIAAMNSGVDYVRVGIGSGQGCITSSNSAIHFPMASLISETRQVRDEYYRNAYPSPSVTQTKIIADGGIRNYSDVVKALALGADYVMIGGLLAGCLEACGNLVVKEGEKEWTGITYNGENISYSDQKFYINKITEKGTYPVEAEIYREFYGMASKKGQQSINGVGAKLKTAEGVCKRLPVTITLKSWVENMESYLRSAMSYCGVTRVEELYDFADCRIMSQAAKSSINK